MLIMNVTFVKVSSVVNGVSISIILLDVFSKTTALEEKLLKGVEEIL
jgi:hypothetical protein